MSTILLAEPGYSGHVFVYLALLARHATDSGNDVTCLISRPGYTSTEYDRHLRGVPGLSVQSVPSPVRLEDIERASIAAHSDVVVIPNGDLYVQDVARKGWAGLGVLRLLVMRDPRWEKPARLPRRLKLIAKMSLIQIAAARGVEIVWLRQPGYSGPERHANDPVICEGTITDVLNRGRELSEELSMHSDTFWFGMTGAIGPHKNLPLVMEALVALHHAAPGRNFGFALLGPLSESLGHDEEAINDMLGALPFQTRRRAGVMTNEEMNAAVSALDCVIMAYSTSSPNSTLGKAAAFGTRVAAAGDSSISAFVADLGMGPTTRLEVQDLASLLEERLTTPSPQPREDLLLDKFCGVLVAPPNTTGGSNIVEA